jgi:plastocyanin
MRLSGALMLVATAVSLGGCTSSDTAGPAGSSAMNGACSNSSAKAATRTFVTASGFAPSCVAIKAGSLFSIVNGSSIHHVAVTRSGAPASFVVDLPRQSSTFSHVYNKKGTYLIVDSKTNKSMTLYVT